MIDILNHLMAFQQQETKLLGSAEFFLIKVSLLSKQLPRYLKKI